MGMFAMTNGASITCDNEKTAKKAIKAINNIEKKYPEAYFNIFSLEPAGETIYFEADSRRVQNLEWQVETIWDEIKNIPGVIELYAPILTEDQGVYRTNEPEATGKPI
jgi:hypothetical protein